MIKEDKDIRCAIVSIDDYGFSHTKLYEGPSIVGIHRMMFADLDGEDDWQQDYLARAEDFEGLKEFIDDVSDKINLLIVHCAAGFSRSPAVTAAIEEYLGLPNTIWGSDLYKPNMHVYKMAKQELT
jgi:predicted protein tyrosine phosphatase